MVSMRDRVEALHLDKDLAKCLRRAIKRRDAEQDASRVRHLAFAQHHIEQARKSVRELMDDKDKELNPW